MMEKTEYSVPEEDEFVVISPSTDQISTPKKKKIKNQRRFSDEQIKLLESMFESDTKLEPRKKLQLARELGLQPRQVAIWFQNRRARWKSKQIEQDYNVLKANFDNLSLKFESLKKAKQSLLIELQGLSEHLEKTQSGSETGEIKYQSEAKPIFSTEGSSGEEGRGILNREHEDCSPASPGKWGNFDTEDIFDQSYGNSQWFNFWN